MRDAAALKTPEVVAMVAGLSSLHAISIDFMLAGLPQIATDFGLANPNDQQLVVLTYVMAFGVGQLVYGPLADAFGRRSVLLWTLAIYLIGTLLCTVAPRFEVLLFARVLQGIGAAATRVIANAFARDLTSGPRLAQILSMAMMVFMIVPIAAPALGQLVLFVAPWRGMFFVLLLYALAILVWMLLRLPETLRPENRTAFRPAAIAGAYARVLSDRQMLGYMAATTFTVSAILAYLSSAGQIFVDVYHLGAIFPLAFSSVAVVISLGAFVNSRLVMRVGVRRMAHAGIALFTLAAGIHALLWQLGALGFWPFLILFSLTMLCFGFTSGNFTALAMERLGSVAGSAAAVFGAFTSFFGAILGGFFARHYDGTPVPFVLSLFAVGVLTLGAAFITERGKLFARPSASG